MGYLCPAVRNSQLIQRFKVLSSKSWIGASIALGVIATSLYPMPSKVFGEIEKGKYTGDTKSKGPAPGAPTGPSSISTSFNGPFPSTNFAANRKQWADSVRKTMTLEEKIGQLFMVAAYSNKGPSHVAEIEKLITQYHIGGLCFFQGGPKRQLALTNRYQALAKIKLLISMDAEWGLGMRLDSALNFPRQMTYGAIHDPRTVYQLGAEMAWQCRRMGVHISFSPDIDVNTNPANPVIGNRSFGENPDSVIRKGLSYMYGLQDNGVIATAKHFPGHGDAASDSHYSLPLIKKSFEDITEQDLAPFRSLISQGIQAVMVAHLQVPALDSSSNKPTSLNRKIVTDLLRKKMGFDGLVFTDALNMKGAAGYSAPGQLEVAALDAGNDVLLYPEDVPAAIKAIKEAITNGTLSEDELDEHVNRILMAKYFAGLNSFTPLKDQSLAEDLNSPFTQAHIESSFGMAATLVRNDQNHIPLRLPIAEGIATITINAPTASAAYLAPLANDKLSSFQETFSNYLLCRHYNCPSNLQEPSYDSLLRQVMGEKYVVVNFSQVTSKADKNYNLPAPSLRFVEKLSALTNVFVAVFGNVYSLKNFPSSGTLMAFYEDNEYTRKLAPQFIVGALGFEGKLPVSVAARMPIGTGIKTSGNDQLTFLSPVNASMDPFILDGLDSLANGAIKRGVTPGCQILVARSGKVVYHKSFGKLDWQADKKTNNFTVYDLASVTKVAATLQAVMKLHDQKLIDLDAPLSWYLPYLIGSNKASLTLRELLLHQAGLVPFDTFWEKTLRLPDSLKSLRPTTSNTDKPQTPVLVANNRLTPPKYLRGRALKKWMKANRLRTAKASKKRYSKKRKLSSKQLKAQLALIQQAQILAAAAKKRQEDSLTSLRNRTTADLYPTWYRKQADSGFHVPVANHLFARDDIKDSLSKWIASTASLPYYNNSPEATGKGNAPARFGYKYSDLSFYYLQQVVEKTAGIPLDRYVQEAFYEPLSAYSLSYNPRNTRQDTLEIAPTEKDTVFRKMHLRGYVHDQMAALQGGIGGHAGLFGRAMDLAKIMQMNLQEGHYNGKNYVSTQTINQFRKRGANLYREQTGVFAAKDSAGKSINTSGGWGYRGLGWDKPPIPNVKYATSSYATPETFGHTGFTGTCVWVDPTYDLVFIFLSNRINPDANNKKITELSIRPRLMDIVYRSILEDFPTVGQKPSSYKVANQQ